MRTSLRFHRPDWDDSTIIDRSSPVSIFTLIQPWPRDYKVTSPGPEYATVKDNILGLATSARSECKFVRVNTALGAPSSTVITSKEHEALSTYLTHLLEENAQFT